VIDDVSPARGGLVPRVTWAHVPTDQHVLEQLAALLSDTEQQELHRLHRRADHARYVARHALLRLLVAESLGHNPAQVILRRWCAVCETTRDHGQLLVERPMDDYGTAGGRPLHVSIASTGNVAMAALSADGPVGVDVESIGGVRFAGFDGVALHPMERRALNDIPESDRARARATWWVRKEALVKATGRGLSIDPRTMAFSCPGVPCRLLVWSDSPLALSTSPSVEDLHLAPEDHAGSRDGNGPDTAPHPDEVVAAVAWLGHTTSEGEPPRPAGLPDTMWVDLTRPLGASN